MKLSSNKILSLLLALVLAMTAAAPAAAATAATDAMVVIYQDDQLIDADARSASGTKDILVIGARDAAKVSVNGVEATRETYTQTQAASTAMYANGRNGVDGTYRIYTAITDGVKTLRVSWADLKTKLEVRVTTRPHDAYAVSARMTPAESCTLSGSTNQTVAANGSYTMSFNPVATQLEIRAITIQTGAGQVKEIPVPESGAATIICAGQEVMVVKSGNTVRVEIPHVVQETAITAQVGNRANRYYLDVSTDGNCSSDTASQRVEQGSAKAVTLTPRPGWNISEVVITSGGEVGTIGFKSSAVTIDGKTYSLTRRVDGAAVLDIPAMTEDVSVQAKATDGKYFVTANSGLYASSEEEGANYITAGQSFAITFEPERDALITGIVITTSSGTYKADAEDHYILVEDQYWRMHTDAWGNTTIYVTEVTRNMEISAEARDTIHEVEVATSARIAADIYAFEVQDGENASVSFTPDAGYEVRQIRIITNGTTYRVDPGESSYIRVDGVRWSLIKGSGGSVTLTLKEVAADVSLFASTSRISSSSSETHRISKTADAHSNVTFTGTNPFHMDEDTTIHVYSDNKYIIKSVRFSMDGDSATIEPFDTSFELAGDTYEVQWESNADCTVYFAALPSDLSIQAKSQKGTEVEWEGAADGTGLYRVVLVPDTHSKITMKQNESTQHGQAVIAGVSADSKYVIDAVQFTMNGKTISISPFTTSFALDGQTCYVNWTTNRQFDVFFGHLTGQLTIRSTAERGTEQAWVGDGMHLPEFSGAIHHKAYMAGFGNGYFGPGQAMTRAQAITILCRLYAGLDNFDSYARFSVYSDTPPGSWYSGYVGYAKTAGLLGVLTTGGSQLRPDQPITRAEFLALLCTFAGENVAGTTTEPRYGDVPSSHWAARYINYATERGWVQGTGDSMFQPDRNVSRAEICVMVNHITGRVSNGAYANYTVGFTDVPASHWAYADIMEAANTHSITGYQNGIEVWAH